jgi:hypothetical protein
MNFMAVKAVASRRVSKKVDSSLMPKLILCGIESHDYYFCHMRLPIPLALILGLVLAAFMFLLSTYSMAQAGTASVIGFVLLRDGKPASNIRVAAMVASGPESAVETLTNFAVTDREGRYRLDGITPGRYFIRASPFGAAVYYPGSLTPQGATAIALPAGATVENINLQFQGDAVTARAVGALSLYPEGLRLHVTPGNFLPVQFPDDGVLILQNLLPGTYTIQVQTTNGALVGWRDILGSPRVFTIVDRDMSNFEIYVPSKIVVRVSAEVDQGQMPFVMAIATEKSGAQVSAYGHRPEDMILEEGEYSLRLEGISGTHTVKSLTYGGVDLTKTPLKVTPTTKSGDLRIVLISNP